MSDATVAPANQSTTYAFVNTDRPVITFSVQNGSNQAISSFGVKLQQIQMTLSKNRTKKEPDLPLVREYMSFSVWVTTCTMLSLLFLVIGFVATLVEPGNWFGLGVPIGFGGIWLANKLVT